MAKRILILGAGVAGAQAIKFIHRQFHGHQGYSLMVVDRQNFSTFAPMLHEAATGSVSSEHVTHPIREIIRCCLETFRQTSVRHIDVKAKTVQTDHGPVAYDYLIVALGAKTNYFNVPGAEEHCFNLKTMDDAIILRRRIIDAFEEATRLPRGPEREARLHFVIIGGGYTGVELAGQLADLFTKDFTKLYPEILADEPRITLVQGGERILPTLSARSAEKAMARLARLGINVRVNTRATSVSAEGVALGEETNIDSKNVIWASGIVANGEAFFDAELLQKGRVMVKATLQVPNHPEVFVIGDLSCVMEGNGPHPQTAQAAFEQAKFASRNLKKLITGEPLGAFYYHHKGDLVPIGDRWAIAEIHGLRFTGFLGWWLRRTVYLSGIFSWADRIQVVFSWTMRLFTPRDTTRL